MRLLRVHIISADTCGGLLDGLNLVLRRPSDDATAFDPLCFIGLNGSGKSQLLQVIAEMFQAVFCACVPTEEREEGNPNVKFEIEYLIKPDPESELIHVRVSRRPDKRRTAKIRIERWSAHDAEWSDCDLTGSETLRLLPQKIVGYSSGDNETLSLPFLVSRSGYAEEVGKRAVYDPENTNPIPDTRLMLIDYGTHLEVLVANLLLGTDLQREVLLKDARLGDLHSFRCIVQLAHAQAPTVRGKKGVKLTPELEENLENLRRCATCYRFDESTRTYTLDYRVDEETRAAFRCFWPSALTLYSVFHKFSMLNDLVIPREARQRFQRATETRRFASRLPEPQDEHKVFRFERVGFVPKAGAGVVDYVSLSDGEHQLAQLLGTFCMLASPNVLFLLDEPESHFNPHWRVKFVSRILDIPSDNGNRKDPDAPSIQQECLLTTHAPFIPSDMRRERIFIFAKSKSKPMKILTFVRSRLLPGSKTSQRLNWRRPLFGLVSK
jgi:restriction system-associated AAA family ATPase